MRKMTKNLFLAICLLISVCLVIGFFGNLIGALAAEEKPVFEQKIYSRATLDKDFDGGSVLVVLDKSISGFDRVHKDSFFGSFEKEYVKDVLKITNPAARSAIDEKEFRQIYEVKLPYDNKENVLQAIAQLEKIKGIKYAGPNYYYELAAVPNDPRFTNGSLWGLNGTYGIKAPEAWNITTGSKDVRVGVIDSGIANHEDLNENLANGFDFYNLDAYYNPTIITNNDGIGHGTHVAGIIGAVGNNSVGVTGVNWNVSLVPLKATVTGNHISSMASADAIAYAADNQIDIINYSVHGFGTDIPVMEAVLQYSGLFVWAAGNDNHDVDDDIDSNGDGVIDSDESFDLPNLISAGAIKSDGERWENSNYSSSNTAVNIYAPGHNILSTISDNTYDSWHGTSMATPHVSGVAALIKSIRPDLSAADVKTAIINNADDNEISVPVTTLTPTSKQTVKRLNAFKAVSSVADSSYNVNVSGGEVEILSPTFTPSGALTIPAQINGMPVTSIGDNAFANCGGLTGVTIPDSVTVIGLNAFANCTNLIVKIQNGTPPIQNNSFADVRALIVPENLLITYQSAWPTLASNNKIHGDFLIENGVLMSYHGDGGVVTIPSGVTEIANNVFMGCNSLTEVKIPSSVTNIGTKAFFCCYALEAITIPFVGNAFSNPSITHFGYLFGAPNYDGQNDYIPKSLKTVTITGGSIDDYAFYTCRELTDVIILDGITSIGQGAFGSCDNLINATIAASVTNIGSYAFSGCSNLSEVTFGGQTTISSTYAFDGNNRVFNVEYQYLSHYSQYLNVYCSSLNYTPPQQPLPITETIPFGSNTGSISRNPALVSGQWAEYTVTFADAGYKWVSFDGWGLSAYLEIYDNGTLIGQRYLGFSDALLFDADANTAYVFKAGFISPTDSGYITFKIWDEPELYIDRGDCYTEAALWCMGNNGQAEIYFYMDISFYGDGMIQLIGSGDIQAVIYDEFDNPIDTVSGGGLVFIGYAGSYKMVITNSGPADELVKVAFLTGYGVNYLGNNYTDYAEANYGWSNYPGVTTLMFYAQTGGTYRLEIEDYYHMNSNLSVYICAAGEYGETIYIVHTGNDVYEFELTAGGRYFITFYGVYGDWHLSLVP